MAEHETVADIIAEMRALSNPISDGIIAIDGRIIADRLDAAHRREREASGDTAALYEALKPVKRYLDGYTVNVLELRRTVDAALTAPARNCDKYLTFNDAIRALANKRGVA